MGEHIRPFKRGMQKGFFSPLDGDILGLPRALSRGFYRGFTRPLKGACVAQGKREVGGFRVCRVFKSWEMTVIVGLVKNFADDDSLMTF